MSLVPVAPALTAGVLLLPIAAGLAGTLLPAFGYLPAIGGHAFGLDPWRRLLDYPGLATSVLLTLRVGLVTPVVALLLALAFCAWASERPLWRRFVSAMTPILATPHSALAIGIAFLLAPSGWIARAVSPWLTGWAVPPDMSTVNDPYGIALTLGLLVKEIPYLVLMIAGALGQVRVRQQVDLARTLGYGRATAWIKVILPQVYPQIRLPVLAVLVFSLSVVDVALILGPGNPPPLAVLAVRWFTDADIGFYFPAAAAAMLLVSIVLLALAAWLAGERLAAWYGRRWIARGTRSGVAPWIAAGSALTLALLAAGLLAIVAMALWSFAAQWRFPAVLPDAWSWTGWGRRFADMGPPAGTTLLLGVVSTAGALLLVVGCLEHDARRRRPTPALWLGFVYLPLLVPQVAFLFGGQVLLVRAGLDGTLAAVTLAHLVFVLPYLYLSLADPWRALDPRYARAAAALGAGPWRTLLTVKLPLLARPVLIACAVGFAVSVAQYLPTLFAGNGRVATLTTEAVTLASGADRRVIGAYATAQAALPFAAYLLAALIPLGLRGRGA